MDHHRRGHDPQTYDHRDHRPPPPPPPFAPPAHPASHAPQEQQHQHYRQQAPPHSQQPQQQPYQQQQQQHPSQHAAGGPLLPPIQPAAAGYPPAPSSSDQPTLPAFRHSSAQPPHEQQQQREGPQQHQLEHGYNRSGHATPAPAPVNRSYSHDSGQQRTPATPTGPTHFPPSSGHDGAQQPPPGAPPPTHSMDHGGHHGYPPTNGVQHHGLPPPPHPHHDQHPGYAITPIMDQHHQYPPPGQPPMYGGPPSYGPTASMNYGPKRKQMRATQACEQCRQRKQKCDEGQPCSFCKENSLNCQYRDTPPAKTDKNMEKLLAYMESHTQGLQDLTAKIEAFESRLRHVEQNTRTNSQSHTQTCLQTNHFQQSGAGAERELTMDDDIAPRSRKPDPEDHRTAPHKLLLLWPTVRPLIQAAGIAYSDSYVMEAEDRGVLRLWTRGESIDEYDGTQPGVLGPASPARSEDSGDVAHAETPSEGLWGTGFPTTPSSNNGRSDPYSQGGLKSNGQLDLDAKTINQLYESYVRNIHVMHPFLDKRRLKNMLESFIHRYSTGRNRASFAVGNDYPSERPLKRQRSNGSGANNVGGTNGSDSDASPQPTERSPGNAIIYLVLALGKICLHKKALPGMVPNSKLETNAAVSHNISAQRYASSPMSANVKQSPMSTNSTPITQPTPLSEAQLRRHESRSRRSSVDDSPSADSTGLRNLDVIPGMAYYARAAEILGDQGDGNDLVHAQMFLLAGLYKGQLARVKESMSWITMAGRAILILLDRHKLYNTGYWGNHGFGVSQFKKSQTRIKDTRQGLIVMASWTCLQLESDILAELRLPASGIQAVEAKLLMPNKVNEDESYSGLETDGRLEDHDIMLIYYSAQLFLRRRLNKVHQEMYGKDSMGKSLEEVLEMLTGHESILESWRASLPSSLQWKDDDPPPKDISNARLRAKYWGARYVINRPFLDYALHIIPHIRVGQTVEASAKDGYGHPRDKADIHLFNAIQRASDDQIFAASKRCIYAAMKSTVAFDGIMFDAGERLIVTNIHGTAHAQFGNMLVLCAVYNNSWMKSNVEADKLSELLNRTISFLRKLSPISPTCKADCGILEKFRNHLFPIKEEANAVYKEEGVEPNSAETSFQGSFNGTAAR